MGGRGVGEAGERERIIHRMTEWDPEKERGAVERDRQIVLGRDNGENEGESERRSRQRVRPSLQRAWGLGQRLGRWEARCMGH